MEAIEKILNNKKLSDQAKYNALMELDATNYTNLGIDSNKSEKAEAKRNSRKIYKAVKGLNVLINNITSDKISEQYLSLMDKK